MSDRDLLHHYAVTTNDPATGDTGPTLAGILTLGDHPEGVTEAARITYNRHPRATDPPGSRHAGTHLEGTVGELLDAAMDRLAQDLDTVQVMRGAGLYDELDVPREALREVLSNALMHRSFGDTQRGTSVRIDVSDAAVVITSPGGSYPGADPATLGLDPIGGGVRNYALVRIAERLRTPSGARIVERQASGINAAVAACLAAASMPALFVDLPTAFQVTLLRGSIDTGPARHRLERAGIPPDSAGIRLLATLMRLDEVRDAVGPSDLDRTVFDARFAARVLHSTVEDAAAELRRLEDAGVLRRTHGRRHPGWAPNPEVATLTNQGRKQTLGQRPRRSPASAGRRDRRRPCEAAVHSTRRGRMPPLASQSIATSHRPGRRGAGTCVVRDKCQGAFGGKTHGIRDRPQVKLYERNLCRLSGN